MGIEVTDICMDKESDCVLVYSNGGSNNSYDETASNNHDVSDSYENINGGSKPQVVEKDTDVKEYEVKECTVENKVEISEACQVVTYEEQNAMGKEVDAAVSKEKVNSEAPKDNTKSRSLKPASKPTAGSVRTNCTVPQPFALATEKRASSGIRPVGTESNVGSGMPKSSNTHTLQPSNTTKPSKPISTLESRKPLQPDNKKHSDEEDSCSVTSSTTASGRIAKFRMTAVSAPVFRCTERAEKRKEFYSKLEEKHQALEAEKNQCEVRTKEEKEVAIKQLRKSLNFKASPMPSFYHEGPPPKTELKKMPPTRAKSPKLGRRKSYSDAVNSSEGEKGKGAYVRGNRHSLGIYKEDITNTRNANSKDPMLLANSEMTEGPNPVR